MFFRAIENNYLETLKVIFKGNVPTALRFTSRYLGGWSTSTPIKMFQEENEREILRKLLRIFFKDWQKNIRKHTGSKCVRFIEKEKKISIILSFGFTDEFVKTTNKFSFDCRFIKEKKKLHKLCIHTEQNISLFLH